MLFFREPKILIDWLLAPDRPCHMIDIETSYGYSHALMTELAGGDIPDRLNVGICGLCSDKIDWDRLEDWCRVLIEREGTSYYQEQALTALLMANASCVVAPAAEYVVLPDKEEGKNPKAILHHYVADSKSSYFRYGWRHFV